MNRDLHHWTPRPRPERRIHQGRTVRLEPLTSAHTNGLFDAAIAPDAEARFRYLPERAPAHIEAFAAWVDAVVSSNDPLFFAVVDQRTDAVLGRQTLMRMDPANGVIEVGNICWGPAMARSTAATEGFFLMAAHVFDDLGYRRFEWKCNDLNTPSKAAALRFGFRPEGVFRQHMIVKGQSRDTAWFAMTDGDWAGLRDGYRRWLSVENFDAHGQQKQRLRAFLPVS